MAEGPIGEIAAWAFLHVVVHLKFVSIFSLPGAVVFYENLPLVKLS